MFKDEEVGRPADRKRCREYGWKAGKEGSRRQGRNIDRRLVAAAGRLRWQRSRPGVPQRTDDNGTNSIASYLAFDIDPSEGRGPERLKERSGLAAQEADLAITLLEQVLAVEIDNELSRIGIRFEA